MVPLTACDVPRTTCVVPRTAESAAAPIAEVRARSGAALPFTAESAAAAIAEVRARSGAALVAASAEIGVERERVGAGLALAAISMPKYCFTADANSRSTSAWGTKVIQEFQQSPARAAYVCLALTERHIFGF